MVIADSVESGHNKLIVTYVYTVTVQNITELVSN